MFTRLSTFLLILLIGCQGSDDEVKLENEHDKVSYGIGLNIGRSLLHDSIRVAPQPFMRGLLDAGRDSSARLMSEQEVMATMTRFQTEMQMAQATRNARLANENMEAGIQFLADNGTKPGVVSLPSGLQYRIIKQGTGPKPTATSAVQVHYTGKLLDGTVFDSSRKRGVPAVFGVKEVIGGWTEALQLMPAGSTWELFIPPDLGYGPNGSGIIPPNATLVFEVELLGIQ